jgi:cyclopropane-fatty-acyl-phospholipid synthase
MTVVERPISSAVIVTSDNRDQLLAGAPMSFRLVCNLVSRIKFGALTFVLPDGPALKFVGGEEPSAEGVIVVKDYAFARRTLFGGDIGFFETFADDLWDTPDVADCLYIFARNVDYVREAFFAAPLVEWIDKMRHAFNKNTRAGARRNITAHYDLGNAFYEKWLDPTMTYSSALFPNPSADLGAAQNNKYKALAERIGAGPDDAVLEIGSGWGGFAEYAAKNVGARVTGVTISKAQFDYAQSRIFKEGLNEKVDFRLQDYRDVEGRFDKIVSIEMFEAVGKEYWPAYFRKIFDALKPGGVAGLQIITIADQLYDRYERSVDFIQRYVFPGGMLASPSVLKDQIERAGLVWKQADSFGQHYARTLREWRRRFLSAWDEIRPMGFDERFRKLWRFYLGYCEAGFRAATTDVHQIVAARG